MRNEYAQVMAENNWTSAEVSKYPHRLLGFCSVNPLRAYALEEIARCAKDRNLRTGLKLHFGNSDVNVNNPDHLARVRQVFRTANEHHMAIVVHMHANIDHHRPYGAKEAQIFLEQLLREAPDVVVQIAHLAGGGSVSTENIAQGGNAYTYVREHCVHLVAFRTRMFTPFALSVDQSVTALLRSDTRVTTNTVTARLKTGAVVSYSFLR